MDWIGIATVIGAVTALLPVLAKFFLDLQSLRKVDADQQEELDVIWSGLVKRGFIGARLAGLILDKDGKETVSDKIRDIFAGKKQDLKQIRRDLARFLGREPLDMELAFEIEKRFQNWLIANVCSVIGVDKYECVALAYLVACENGSKDHRPDSWAKK